MQDFTQSAALILIGFLAWDVARRFIALQARKIATNESLAEFRADLVRFADQTRTDADALRSDLDEANDRLAKIVTATAGSTSVSSARQRMRLGGMG